MAATTLVLALPTADGLTLWVRVGDGLHYVARRLTRRNGWLSDLTGVDWSPPIGNLAMHTVNTPGGPVGCRGRCVLRRSGREIDRRPTRPGRRRNPRRVCHRPGAGWPIRRARRGCRAQSRLSALRPPVITSPWVDHPTALGWIPRARPVAVLAWLRCSGLRNYAFLVRARGVELEI